MYRSRDNAGERWTRGRRRGRFGKSPRWSPGSRARSAVVEKTRTAQASSLVYSTLKEFSKKVELYRFSDFSFVPFFLLSFFLSLLRLGGVTRVETPSRIVRFERPPRTRDTRSVWSRIECFNSQLARDWIEHGLLLRRGLL